MCVCVFVFDGVAVESQKALGRHDEMVVFNTGDAGTESERHLLVRAPGRPAQVEKSTGPQCEGLVEVRNIPRQPKA